MVGFSNWHLDSPLIMKLISSYLHKISEKIYILSHHIFSLTSYAKTDTCVKFTKNNRYNEPTVVCDEENYTKSFNFAIDLFLRGTGPF